MKKKNQKKQKEEKTTKAPVSKKKGNTIEDDFNSFADPNTQTIQEDGMVKMGKLLGIDIYSDVSYFFYIVSCLLLSFFINAKPRQWTELI